MACVCIDHHLSDLAYHLINLIRLFALEYTDLLQSLMEFVTRCLNFFVILFVMYGVIPTNPVAISEKLYLHVGGFLVNFARFFDWGYFFSLIICLI